METFVNVYKVNGDIFIWHLFIENNLFALTRMIHHDNEESQVTDAKFNSINISTLLAMTCKSINLMEWLIIT